MKPTDTESATQVPARYRSGRSGTWAPPGSGQCHSPTAPAHTTANAPRITVVCQDKAVAEIITGAR